MTHYQKAVKNARSAYFSDLPKNNRYPRVISMINSVLNDASDIYLIYISHKLPDREYCCSFHWENTKYSVI